MANENINYGTPVQPTSYQVQAPVAPQNVTPPALPNNYDELAKAQPSTLDFMQKTDAQLGIPGQQKITGTGSCGGSSFFGGGGRGASGQGNGFNATGHGAGGGGGNSINVAGATTGGAATAGCIWYEEYS